MTTSSAPHLDDKRPDDTGLDIVELEGAAVVFTETRPQLFGIVYRITGSVTEAEDVLQEAWIRWHTTGRSVVRNPQAFLTTTVTRLALNVLQSARSRHETYSGPALAPRAVDTSTNPTLGAEQPRSGYVP